ncbi:MAG: hypothetical protein ACL9RN_00135 [Cylindrospermopsis raciborskii]
MQLQILDIPQLGVQNREIALQLRHSPGISPEFPKPKNLANHSETLLYHTEDIRGKVFEPPNFSWI